MTSSTSCFSTDFFTDGIDLACPCLSITIASPCPLVSLVACDCNPTSVKYEFNAFSASLKSPNLTNV